MNKRLRFFFQAGVFAIAGFLTIGVPANTAVAQENVITNGNFSTGDLTGWTTYVADFAGAAATFGAADSVAGITGIANALAEPWHVQMLQVLTAEQIAALEVDSTYQLSFKARGGVAERPLRYYFGQGGDAYNPLTVSSVALTTEMKTYTVTFKVTAKFDAMKLSFEAGLSNADVFMDDISLVKTAPVANPLNLPVTFEDAELDYKIADFGGNVSALVTDPTDSDNKVVRSVKGASAEVWAGTTVGSPDGFAEAIPFTATETKMNVRVWSPQAGLQVRLKVEDSDDATISVETEATTTVNEGWQTLEFDFSNQATGTAALNLANTYNKASIFFNFGVAGATAGELTFYWDDMRFGAASTGTSIETIDGIPTDIRLSQNYPNPFNPTTQIQYALPEAGNVRLEVFNMVGQRVGVLVDQPMNAGVHTVMFDAAGLSSGVYMYRLQAGNKTLIQQMTLIK